MNDTLSATNKKIFLAGEGKNELGSWANEPDNRNQKQKGVLETLLLNVKDSGWTIKDAICWKNIRKYKVGEHRSPDQRAVIGACLMAVEKGCTAIAFTRDSDGVKDRVDEVKNGIKDSLEKFNFKTHIIGGCAEPFIEAWILAVSGKNKTEQISTDEAKKSLESLGIETTSQMTDCIEACGIDNIPDDAKSLKDWLKQAEAVL
ncbi:MAG TPA: hypothetical protein DCO75_08440 [Fibrobacteres bacterium]|nr:hypothetical protein [Fibrobacterota bacterium]